MIISASRRTDIPAFYMRWFLKKLQQGSVVVRNPFNKNQQKTVSLAREEIDFIVFWTRDASALLRNSDELHSYQIPYYVNYTLTGYGREYESRARNIDESIDTLIHLSDKIGKSNIIWRYDPILISEELNTFWHKENFTYILKKINKKINRIIISIVDEYKKNKKNLCSLGVLSPHEHREKYADLVQTIAEICAMYKVPLQSCSEELISHPAIPSGACIDPSIIYRDRINNRRDYGQRRACHCCPSVDIGEYNSCFYGCQYCYATGRAPKKLFE